MPAPLPSHQRKRLPNCSVHLPVCLQAIPHLVMAADGSFTLPPEMFAAGLSVSGASLLLPLPLPSNQWCLLSFVPRGTMLGC